MVIFIALSNFVLFCLLYVSPVAETAPNIVTGESPTDLTMSEQPSTIQLTSPSHDVSSLDTTQLRNKRTHIHHIAAMFKVDNFTAHALAFQEAISLTNAADLLPTHISLEGLALPAEHPFENPHSALIYVCDAIYNHNVTSFLAVGDQDMINILSIVTQYLGVPLISYNTDKYETFVRVSQQRTIVM